MPIPTLDAGVLPPGRHRCTLAEVEQQFVLDPSFAASVTRPAIWQDWQTALTLLTDSALVYTAWISGSFVTSKIDPGDIDACFALSIEDALTRSPADRAVIESFIRRIHGPAGHPVPAHGLRVDSYPIWWAPFHGEPEDDAKYLDYCRNRGYWDDFWSRSRTTPKGAPPERPDAYPVRGYLEVRINDYA